MHLCIWWKSDPLVYVQLFSDSEKTQKGNVSWPYRTLVLCMFLAFNSGESPSITKREATQSKSIFQVRQQHSNRHNDADTRQDIATSGIILHENCCHWSVARWSIQMCFDDSVCLFVKCCIRWHGGIYHRYRFVYHRPLCSNSCPSAPSWLFTTRDNSFPIWTMLALLWSGTGDFSTHGSCRHWALRASPGISNLDPLKAIERQKGAKRHINFSTFRVLPFLSFSAVFRCWQRI